MSRSASQKAARRAPQEIARAIVAAVLLDPEVRASVVEATATAGFINLRLAPAYWQRAVARILALGPEYGKRPKIGERISLEFGSANPTGPLVVVQGRALSIGSTLASVLRFAGYDVFTEWIINDAGSQLDELGRSLYARYRQLWDPSFSFSGGRLSGRVSRRDRRVDSRTRRRSAGSRPPTSPRGSSIFRRPDATRSSPGNKRFARGSARRSISGKASASFTTRARCRPGSRRSRRVA